MTRMTNKVALVVGGAKGIGLAIAERLAAEGAAVFLTGRRAEEVDSAAEKIGRGARGIVADASVPQDVSDAIAMVRDRDDADVRRLLEALGDDAASVLGLLDSLLDDRRRHRAPADVEHIDIG